MRSRGEIDFALTTDSPRTIAEQAIATRRTRLPLCEPDGGLDAAVGAVHAKDLLQLIFADGRSIDLSTLTRPLGHVSESARVDQVLRQMRNGRVHLSLVHDEHGTVIGLLALEDILEELVGEIDDEFDTDRPGLVSEHDGRLWVDGRTPVRAIATRFELDLEEHDETTVNGYLLEQLGRVPDVGEVIDVNGYGVEIVAVDGTQITLVAVAPSRERCRRRPGGDSPLHRAAD
jgi:magnesium and cobalt transporter